MGFLQKVRGLSILDKVKSTDICQSLNIELLLLCIERLQLCWYGHVMQMPHKRTAKQLVNIFSSGKSSKSVTQNSLVELCQRPAWLCLGIPLAELPIIAGD